MTHGDRGLNQGDSPQRDAAWVDVHDPNTSSARLAEIGGRYPEFAKAIIAHPSCYPELAEWARHSGLLDEPAVTSKPMDTESLARATPAFAVEVASIDQKGSGNPQAHTTHHREVEAFIIEAPMQVSHGASEVRGIPAVVPVGYPAVPVTTPELVQPASESPMSQGHLKTVLLLGLLGGVLSAAMVNIWYWLLNNAFDSLLLDYSEGWGVRALWSTGALAVMISSHGLFAGLLLRRSGVILATLALTVVTYFPTDHLLESMLYPDYDGGDLMDGLGEMLASVGCGVMLVGVAGEMLRRFLSKFPDSVIIRATTGMAVPVGWTLCLLVQMALGRGGWPDGFELFDWVIWLIGIAVAGFVFSGLIPAAISGRWVTFAADSSVPQLSAASPAHPASGAEAVSLDSRGESRQQSADVAGANGLSEHPKSTQVLMFALLGMFVFAPLAVAAWVTGARAKAEIARNPGRYRPSPSLQAGYVVGIIGTLIWAAGILILVAVLGWLFTLS